MSVDDDLLEAYHAAVQELRMMDPETGGQKGQKLRRYDLLPVTALDAAAEHFGRGAAKYEDRNWERGYNWSLSYGALLRHLTAWWNGEDMDPDPEMAGSHHLDAVLFHAMVLRTFATRNTDKDDRPHGNSSGTHSSTPSA